MELRIIGFVFIGMGVAMLTIQLYQHRKENSFLKEVLSRVIGANRITARDQLVKLKNHLLEHIQYDMDKRDANRPPLRATARATYQNAYGFCGENARLFIRLLHVGGVRANRVYLEGSGLYHVLLEHEWEGNWYVLDGHNDELITMSDDEVTAIPSSDPTRFPNRYEGNGWERAFRNKQFHQFGFKGMAAKRPSSLTSALMESPHLIMAAIGVVDIILGAVLVALSL